MTTIKGTQGCWEVRGHYDIATDVPDRHRLRIAFDDLALTI
jgi:hypothetical protein